MGWRNLSCWSLLQFFLAAAEEEASCACCSRVGDAYFEWSLSRLIYYSKMSRKYPDWDIWDILYYLVRYKMSRGAPLLPILNGKCRPTTCGGWGDRMDSNDGGCVQSWMTGWLGSWTHRNFFFFLLQRYWVTLEFFNLLSRYIYLPTYLSLSESHCKWWYLSINNLMKLVLLTYVCYYVVFTIHFESKGLSW